MTLSIGCRIPYFKAHIWEILVQFGMKGSDSLPLWNDLIVLPDMEGNPHWAQAQAYVTVIIACCSAQGSGFHLEE